MGKCPNPTCPMVYTRKPVKCNLCWAYIGGAASPGPAPKKEIACEKRKCVKVTDKLYSVFLSQAYRTIVTRKDSDDKFMCSYHECVERRGVNVQNNKFFECPHVKTVCNVNETKHEPIFAKTCKEMKERVENSLYGKELQTAIESIIDTVGESEVLGKIFMRILSRESPSPSPKSGSKRILDLDFAY